MTPQDLRAALTGPRRDLGRFAAVFAPDGVALAPRALVDAPGRVGTVVGHRALLAAPPGVGRGWALRLATAIRQDLWRGLRAARGLAPVVIVRLRDGGAEVHAAAAFLDDATAAPGTLDALRRMFHDGSTRRWRVHADRAADRGRARCSTRS